MGFPVGFGLAKWRWSKSGVGIGSVEPQVLPSGSPTLSFLGSAQSLPTMPTTCMYTEAPTFPGRFKEKLWGADQIWRVNSHTQPCMTTW